jgi:3-hydroxybutyryl-CoA dehydratase
MPAQAQSSVQTGLFFEDLAVGMTASYSKTVSEKDILQFAEATGDRNPLHMDAAFAAKTIFKERIAHGILTAGFISATFASKLPGPGGIYVSQSLKFKAPVKIGDVVTARVEITGLAPEKKFVNFRTQCFVGDKIVLDGEATLMLPSRG